MRFLSNMPTTTDIYTLSLHDALPIYSRARYSRESSSMNTIDLFCGAGGSSEGARQAGARVLWAANHNEMAVRVHAANHPERSEEHTSELQSQFHLVCRLLLEKKNKTK